MDFYDKLLFKTLGPLAIVALLWVWPLIQFVRRKPHVKGCGTAAKLSLNWLELVLVSVSTTIMQCFM